MKKLLIELVDNVEVFNPFVYLPSIPIEVPNSNHAYLFQFLKSDY